MSRVNPRPLLCLALLLTLLSCERSHPERQVRSGPESASGAPAVQTVPATKSSAHDAVAVHRATAAASTAVLSQRLARAPAELVVAIGDLHGDLAATRRALRLAGAIDESDRWIGGKLVVVQTGDVLDRGDDDKTVLELLERLQTEAAHAGGELLLLNGNHELMNVAADLRYVTPASLAAFSSEGGRAAAFAPGSRYARQLAEHPLLVKVGSTLFVHGGILPSHVSYGLDRMNDEVVAWMRGELPEPPQVVMVADGLIWTRLYSSPPEACESLRKTLDALGARRMVVGHTVQAAGINPGCGGLVWRIDVGLSAFYGGSTEVLEIRGDVLTVRRANAPIAPQVQRSSP
jgi:hypothetical protein